jgi:CubicO group peptidase (beta-lactamase class C family)
VAFGATAFFPGAPLVTPDTIFDIASLTKVVGTTTLALGLLEEGVFGLDTELGELLGDGMGGSLGALPREKAQITMEQLLTHTSGLPAWLPLYLEAQETDDAIRQILACPLEYAPGTQVVYSCLGFILLGYLLQSLTGLPLDKLLTQRVLLPLKMEDTCYNPSQALYPRVAYTEWCPRSKQFLRGKVHDENAQALHGISGNAGLFSTAGDLAKFAQMILSGGLADNQALLSETTLGLLGTCFTEGLNDRRTLGWMLPTPGSSGGNLLSDTALGHTGFTGTSLWIDAAQNLFVILLTNRVHPTRTNEALFRLRPAFHNSVVTEIGAK